MFRLRSPVFCLLSPSSCLSLDHFKLKKDLLSTEEVAQIVLPEFASEAEAFEGLYLNPVEVFLPDHERHATYRRLYEQGYLRLQNALRHHFNEIEKELAEYE